MQTSQHYSVDSDLIPCPLTKTGSIYDSKISCACPSHIPDAMHIRHNYLAYFHSEFSQQ